MSDECIKDLVSFLKRLDIADSGLSCERNRLIARAEALMMSASSQEDIPIYSSAIGDDLVSGKRDSAFSESETPSDIFKRSTKSGCLKVRSSKGLFAKPKERTALLYGSFLLLYSKSKQEPSDTIAIKDAEIKQHQKDADRFLILSASHKNPTFEFTADDAQDCQDWIMVLKAAANGQVIEAPLPDLEYEPDPEEVQDVPIYHEPDTNDSPPDYVEVKEADEPIYDVPRNIAPLKEKQNTERLKSSDTVDFDSQSSSDESSEPETESESEEDQPIAEDDTDTATESCSSSSVDDTESDSDQVEEEKRPTSPPLPPPPSKAPPTVATTPQHSRKPSQNSQSAQRRVSTTSTGSNNSSSLARQNSFIPDAQMLRDKMQQIQQRRLTEKVDESSTIRKERPAVQVVETELEKMMKMRRIRSEPEAQRSTTTIEPKLPTKRPNVPPRPVTKDWTWTKGQLKPVVQGPPTQLKLENVQRFQAKVPELGQKNEQKDS